MEVARCHRAGARMVPPRLRHQLQQPFPVNGFPPGWGRAQLHGDVCRWHGTEHLVPNPNSNPNPNWMGPNTSCQWRRARRGSRRRPHSASPACPGPNASPQGSPHRHATKHYGGPPRDYGASGCLELCRAHGEVCPGSNHTRCHHVSRDDIRHDTGPPRAPRQETEPPGEEERAWAGLGIDPASHAACRD